MKAFIYSFLVLSFSAFGQGGVGYILEENAADSIVKRTVKTHSSIKPLIRQNSDIIKGNKTFQISGLGDLNYIQNRSVLLSKNIHWRFYWQSLFVH